MSESYTTAPVAVQYRNGEQGVNARDLHAYLGSKRQFADWVQKRIEQYEFVAGEDYEVFHNFVKNLQGGRPSFEYFISVDMAKELCLVEHNEQGRLCRRYFIGCEQEAQRMASLVSYFKGRRSWTFGEVHRLIRYAMQYTPPLTIADIARLMGRDRGTVRPIVHLVRGDLKVSREVRRLGGEQRGMELEENQDA